MSGLYNILQQPVLAAAVIFFILYVFTMNILGVLLMGTDKIRSLEKRFRIPERTLFLVSLSGGSLGTLLGMWVFHHKTRHWYFRLFMPLIFLLHAALIILGILKLMKIL